MLLQYLMDRIKFFFLGQDRPDTDTVYQIGPALILAGNLFSHLDLGSSKSQRTMVLDSMWKTSSVKKVLRYSTVIIFFSASTNDYDRFTFNLLLLFASVFIYQFLITRLIKAVQTH